MSETATLGGGCFWCIEAVYNEIEGVESALSGYSGGTMPDPSYEDVCTGRTGHAEVVQVTFDPSVLSYRVVLEVFFSVHDPTQLDRQGNDVGTQYRSVIFTHSKQQGETVRAVIRELEEADVWGKPIVTKVEPFERFWEAEDYHQGYFKKNPRQPYCAAVVGPKVAKFRVKWAHRLRSEATA